MLKTILILFILMLELTSVAGSDPETARIENEFRKEVALSVQRLTINRIRIANSERIPLEKLNEVQPLLSINVIDRPQSLKGGLKSAIAKGRQVTLYKEDWSEVKDPREFRRMVLHELMRVVGVPDDDYRVSEELEVAVNNYRELTPEVISKFRVFKLMPLQQTGQSQVNSLCEGVVVFCGAIETNAGGDVPMKGPKATLGRNEYYRGKCRDTIPYCP